MGMQLANGPLIGLPVDLTRFPRPALEALTEALIGHLDALDGDPDLEDDDPAGQCDEDGMNTGTGSYYGLRYAGPGCPISDTDEREQMPGDVPALHVFSLEHDPATGQRTYLGRSNMTSAFRVGGAGELSADSGAVHILRGWATPLSPGVPV